MRCRFRRTLPGKIDLQRSHKMRLRLFLLPFLLTFSAAASDSGVEFSGDHRAVFSVPAVRSHDEYSGNIKSPRLENDFSLLAENSTVTLYAGLRVTSQLYPKTEDETVSFSPLENTLSLEGDMFQTSLGFQYYSWGSADKLNPTDLLNPRDYTTGPDAEKMSLFSASLKLYPTDRLSFVGVYAPYDQPDRFPVQPEKKISPALFSRSYIESISLSQSGLVTESKQIAGEKRVTVSDPTFTPSSFLAGGRLRYMGSFFDLAASYVYDLDQYYTPEIEVTPYALIDENTSVDPLLPPEQLSVLPSQAYGLKEITLTRRRIHRIGMDAKAVVDRYGFWGEACLSLTDQKDGENKYASLGHQLDWTAGFDFSYGSFDQHYVNLQQIGRYIFDYDDDFSASYPDGQPSASDLANRQAMEDYYYRLLTNRLAYATEGLLVGGAVKAEWSFLDGNVKPSLEGVYVYPFSYDDAQGKRYGDLIGKAQVTWRAADAAQISFGTQGYYSILKPKGMDEICNETENRVGMYFPDSRVFLEGTFSWIR